MKVRKFMIQFNDRIRVTKKKEGMQSNDINYIDDILNQDCKQFCI